MNTQVSPYDQQAIDFLLKTGAIMEITFSNFGKHFEEDKEERDIYTVTIIRNGRQYTFKFGNSLNATGRYIARYQGGDVHFQDINSATRLAASSRDVRKNPNFKAPTYYDVLAALTKTDPGLFQDFCKEFGYDTDSRRAERIYNAVRDEYLHLANIFSSEELEQMQEIQ